VLFRVGGPRPGTYPVAAVDASLNAARTIFAAKYDPELAPDEVVRVLAQVGASAEAAPQRGAGMDLAGLTELAARTPGLEVVERLINLRDLCFGAVVRWKRNDVYVPLEFSAHAPNLPRPAGDSGKTQFIKARYGARPAPAPAGPVCEVARLMGVRPAARLEDSDGRAIGFVAERAGSSLPGLYFFHAPADKAPKFVGPDLPVVLMPRDTRALDQAIFDGQAPESHGPGPHVLEARHWQYRLFVAEFAAAVREERDLERRARVLAAAGPAEAEAALGDVLPEDHALLRDLLRRVRRAGGRGAFKKRLQAAMAAVRFRFDELTPTRLRALSTAAMRAALTAYMRPLVEFGDPAAVSNSYAACGQRAADQPQCREGKLLVPEKEFSDLVELLAADLHNPIKDGVLTLYTSGVIDELKFEERAGESIELRIG